MLLDVLGHVADDVERAIMNAITACIRRLVHHIVHWLQGRIEQGLIHVHLNGMYRDCSG